jgi:hypothetical protein
MSMLILKISFENNNNKSRRREYRYIKEARFDIHVE